MEFQQETLGFDNGDSEQDAITRMNEEQCQQAISMLEYYAEKFGKYVEGLRQLEDHRKDAATTTEQIFAILKHFCIKQ